MEKSVVHYKVFFNLLYFKKSVQLSKNPIYTWHFSSGVVDVYPQLVTKYLFTSLLYLYIPRQVTSALTVSNNAEALQSHSSVINFKAT